MTDPKLCIYNDDTLSLKIDEYLESPLVVSQDVEERCKSLRVEQMQEKATVERFSILFQSTFSTHNLPLVSPIQPYTIPDWAIYRPATIIAYFVKSIHLSSHHRLNTPPSLVIAI